MKYVKLLIIAIFLTAFAGTAAAQNGYSGKVVEVLDGKTVRIEMLNGNVLKAELQYIEVPEPEQEFHSVAKDHLAKLILGKVVEFRAQRMIDSRPMGRVFLNGIDISQQMIRDGAAWYAVPEQGSQDTYEREGFQMLESQAKVEKRGIWSVENLTPAWEFRAQKEEERRRQERAEQEARIAQANQVNLAKAKRAAAAEEERARANAEVEIWADVNGTGAPKNAVPGVEGLFAGYDPATKVGYSMTAGKFFTLEAGGKAQKVECRVFYVYRGGLYDPTESAFVIGFLAAAPQYRFEKVNNLTFTVDKKVVPLGKATRFYRKNFESSQELLLYKVTKPTLVKIAGAKDLRVSVGGYAGPADAEFRNLVDTLLKNL